MEILIQLRDEIPFAIDINELYGLIKKKKKINVLLF